MIDGMINVCKEKGFTSHDVVAKLRGILKQKKIGHTGTLDPDAVGVLPVCLGKATKLCDMIADKDKVYEAVMRLGETTDTQDISGTVLHKTPADFTVLSKEAIEEAALSFVGDYDQLPPMYSAIKVGGKKLYELAREGKEIERSTRSVHIFNITISDICENKTCGTIDVTMRVHCSKGTYIRTLCHDIGEKLGTGGCMASLVRLKVGRFELSQALTLSEIEALAFAGDIKKHIVAVDDMLLDYPAVRVSERANRLLYNGNPLAVSDVEIMSEQQMSGQKEKSESKASTVFSDGRWLRVYDTEGHFAAVYAYSEQKKLLKTVKMFL